MVFSRSGTDFGNSELASPVGCLLVGCSDFDLSCFYGLLNIGAKS